MNNNNVVTNANSILPVNSVKPNDSKMSLLMSATLVLGLLTLLTLVAVLSYNKNTKNNTPLPTPQTENVEVTAPVETEEEVDDELGRKKLMKEIDNLELEAVSNSYSEEEFEKDLEVPTTN